MPRGPRLDAPGAIHHIMLRGLDRQRIFHDDADRGAFVDRLARQLDGGAADCFAWALMPNHVHLVLRTGNASLSRTMARVNTGYARWHNRRHGRTGYLFENRFKSLLVDNDAYLRNLVGYVHRNPLRDGIVASLADLARYPWCGYGALLGYRERRFETVEEVLAWFGGDPASARIALATWMGDAAANEAHQIAHRGEARSIDPAAAQPFDPRGRRKRSPSSDLRTLHTRQRIARGWSLAVLVAWVCVNIPAREAAVRAGHRDARSSHARAVIAHLATCELGLPARRVAAELGVSAGALSRAVARGRRLAVRYELSLGDASPPVSARRGLAVAPESRSSPEVRKGN